MTGPQLTLAIAAVLLFAVALGWMLHWLWCRMGLAPGTTEAQMREMVDRLHTADRNRETAEEARIRAESRLAAREAEMENRLAVMQSRLDGVLEGREAELTRELREAKAELDALSDGLRHARIRIAELEGR